MSACSGPGSDFLFPLPPSGSSVFYAKVGDDLSLAIDYSYFLVIPSLIETSILSILMVHVDPFALR
jgi:hypothetical protein